MQHIHWVPTRETPLALVLCSRQACRDRRQPPRGAVRLSSANLTRPDLAWPGPGLTSPARPAAQRQAHESQHGDDAQGGLEVVGHDRTHPHRGIPEAAVLPRRAAPLHGVAWCGVTWRGILTLRGYGREGGHVPTVSL